jgi:hypothetical protein
MRISQKESNKTEVFSYSRNRVFTEDIGYSQFLSDSRLSLIYMRRAPVSGALVVFTPERISI